MQACEGECIFLLPMSLCKSQANGVALIKCLYHHTWLWGLFFPGRPWTHCLSLLELKAGTTLPGCKLFITTIPQDLQDPGQKPGSSSLKTWVIAETFNSELRFIPDVVKLTTSNTHYNPTFLNLTQIISHVHMKQQVHEYSWHDVSIPCTITNTFANHKAMPIGNNILLSQLKYWLMLKKLEEKTKSYENVFFAK